MCNCCKNAGSPSLKHENPDLFDRSQWCPTGKVSVPYAAYRIILAFIFIGGVGWHMYNSQQGAKWFIYMTDQGIFFLTLHYVLEAILVLARFSWEKRNKDPKKMYHTSYKINFFYKISWGMGTCFFTIALWISIIYWGVLHAIVVKENLLKTDLAKGLNVFLHAINSISCLLDIFISARPWRVLHFYLPTIFGLWYTFFSIIYWAAGGVGICRESTIEGVTDCDKFIYPFLDWEDNPSLAVGMIVGGCVCVPLFHFFWIGLSKLRVKMSNKVQNSSDVPRNGQRGLIVSSSFSQGQLRFTTKPSHSRIKLNSKRERKSYGTI